MKKSLLFLLVLLMTIPAIASAETNHLYVEVTRITSAREMECVAIFEPECYEFTAENATVKVSYDMPEEVMEAIAEQKIALITVDNKYVTDGKTIVETGSVRPAVYYAVMLGYSPINAEENAVGLNLSKITGCEVIFPEDIDVSAILNEEIKLATIQFSPYIYEKEPYIRKVYAKDVSFPPCAYGFIAEIGKDTVSVDIYPFNNNVYPDVRKTNAPPVQFTITENTIWAEQLLFEPVGTEVVVIYDEETMEALAMIYYHG